MVSLEVTVVNRLGMHARAAARFVREASRHTCEVWLRKGNDRVNGKSIMGILTLAGARGEKLVIEADGPDEAAALQALGELVRGGFGEEIA
jgi:phosphocarrier protein HPr